MVLTSLAASILITSVPTDAYAGTPDYDPVFYYYHPDHLGSSQLMTDRDGDVVQQYGYSPFGRENYQNNTYAFSVSNRYTGQTLDEETGLYYYGARYYDPELARFIQADSTVPDPEFSQAYNRYAYVYNNPLKFTDPSGQFPWAIAWAIVEATVEALPTIMISTMISASIACVAGANPKDAFLGALTANLGGFLFGAIAGGALAAAVTGGDPVQGAISAGVSAGVQVCLGFSPAPSSADFLSGEYLLDLALSTASGAVSGGVTAEILGGDFAEGAISGGFNAGSNYVVWSALQGMPAEGEAQSNDPLPVAAPDIRPVAYTTDLTKPVTSEPVPVWLGYVDAIPGSTSDESPIGYRAIVDQNFKVPKGFWERLAGGKDYATLVAKKGATRIHQFAVKRTLPQFEKHLLRNGWKQVATKGDTKGVQLFIKGTRAYVLRPENVGTSGLPTAQFLKVVGKGLATVAEIRLIGK